MVRYKKTQIAWAIVGLQIIVTVFIAFASMNNSGEPNQVNSLTLVILAILLLLVLMFYVITVIVTDEHVKIKYGFGLFSKQIEISRIESISSIGINIYHGYGIKKITNGVLYNTGKSIAIELKLTENEIIQIGTNDSETLKAVLDKTV
ncbi:MAG: hypothetical protein IPO21_10440 [Bacteroidales bacterium]|nr:hypothetical protein [Bacteroidales bacterium]